MRKSETKECKQMTMFMEESTRKKVITKDDIGKIAKIEYVKKIPDRYREDGTPETFSYVNVSEYCLIISEKRGVTFSLNSSAKFTTKNLDTLKCISDVKDFEIFQKENEGFMPNEIILKKRKLENCLDKVSLERLKKEKILNYKKKSVENPFTGIFTNFILSDENPNGAMVLSCATGVGKSYTARQVVLNILNEYVHDVSNEQHKKFIFLTSRKGLREEFYAPIKKKMLEDPELSKYKIIKLDSLDDSIKIGIEYLKKNLNIESRNFEQQQHEITNFIYDSLKRNFFYTEKKLSDLRIEDFKTSVSEFISSYYVQDAVIEQPFCDKRLKETVQNEYKKIKTVFKNNLTKIMKDKYYQAIVPETQQKKSRKCFNKEQYFKDLEENCEIKWITEMFPGLLAETADILIMTHAKYCSPNFDIANNSKSIYQCDYANNAVIFIDEFNDLYETLLQMIIETQYKRDFNLIELFIDLKRGIDELHKDREKGSRQRKLWTSSKDTNGKSVLESLLLEAEEIIKEVDLFREVIDLSENGERHYLYRDYNDFNSTFDYFDGKNNKMNLYILTGKDYKTYLKENHILYDNEKFVDESYYIVAMENGKSYTELKKFMNKLERFVYKAGTCFKKYILPLYYSWKNPKHKFSEDYMLLSQEEVEEWVTQCLNFPNFYNNKLKDFMVVQVTDYYSNQRGENISIDTKFTTNRFSIVKIDHLENRHKARFLTYSLKYTPDDFLLEFSKKNKIVIMSATAYEDSIFNFNFQWFREMGMNIIELKEDEKENVQKFYSKKDQHYDDVNIHYIPISPKENKYMNKELADFIRLQIRRKIGIVQDYVLERYLRFANVYYFHLLNKDVFTTLSFWNVEPDKDKEVFENDILNFICATIFRYLESNGVADRREHLMGENYFYFLKGESLKERTLKDKIDELNQSHAQGLRSFIVATYAAVAKGMNMEFEITRADIERGLIAVNEFDYGKDNIDVPCIYIDRVTNYLQYEFHNPKRDEVKKQQLHALFDVGQLCVRAEISKHIKRKLQQKIMNNKSINGFIDMCINKEGKEVPYFKVSYTPSRSSRELNTYAQALGRIGRNSIKNKDIYILYDASISVNTDVILPEQIENSSYEFKGFLKYLNHVGSGKEETDYAKNNKAKNYLRVKFDRGGKFLKKYQAILDYDESKVATVEKINKVLNQNIGITRQQYMELSNEYRSYYFYTHDNNLRGIKFENIYFLCIEDNKFSVSYQVDLKKFPGASAYSFDITNIPRVCKSDYLQSLLEKEGYQTEIPEDAEYFLIPQALYKVKGNMAETILHTLFEEVFKIRLVKTINGYDSFEKFDEYHISEEAGLCDFAIDYKNWNYDLEMTQHDKYDNKYFERLDKLGIPLGFIVNLYPTYEIEGREVQIKENVVHRENKTLVKIPFILNERNQLDEKFLHIFNKYRKGK